MKCHICDAELTDKEVNWNKELEAFEPCTLCLDIAMDAAYCDGFVTEDESYTVLDSSFDGSSDVPLTYELNDNEEW